MLRHAQRIHATMDATVQAATVSEETRWRAQVAAVGTPAPGAAPRPASRAGSDDEGTDRRGAECRVHTRNTARACGAATARGASGRVITKCEGRLAGRRRFAAGSGW